MSMPESARAGGRSVRPTRKRKGVCVVVVIGAALGLSTGSCGSSSSGSAPGSSEDAGSDERAVLADTSLAQDASSGTDASLSMSSDGGSDGGACGQPQTTLGAACDGCVAVNCEPAWCTCASESPAAGTVDSGGGSCLGYAKCVEDCVAQDAGSPTSCFQPICATPAYTTVEEQGGHAYLDCVVQYCASECGT
jgi:hypothetical protein